MKPPGLQKSRAGDHTNHFRGPSTTFCACVLAQQLSKDLIFDLDMWHCGSSWPNPGQLSRSKFNDTGRK